ncbi:MAG: PKD domain-containing protein, partial [Bacteroidales bacterium]|nr:PKD domain-containing protein [Bacteroidales bacterium]
VSYEVTVSSCTSTDTEDIVVSPGPDATITPVDPFCIYDATYDLESATSTGTWEGDGIVDVNTGLFDPSLAGLGRHSISFTTAPDGNGCFGTDTLEVAVMDIPSARFLTPDSAWCEQENNQTTAEILVTGTDSSTFDLVIEMQGTIDTIEILSNGVLAFLLDNQPGTNEYRLIKIIEHHGNNSCEQLLIDALVMQVNPLPVITLTANYDNSCSPVAVDFVAEAGYNKYSWDFGDGQTDEKNTNTVSHTYTYDYTDNIIVIGDDSVYDFTRHDTVFRIVLTAETANGCVGTLEDSIRIHPNPRARFYPTPTLQNYPDSVVYVINQSSPGPWEYLWDYGDAQQDTAEEPLQHIYNLWGFYDIELKVFSPFCRDSVIQTVQIKPPPPVAYFEPDTAGCPPLSVSFSNNSLFAETYVWDFDDNHFSSDPNPTHIFYDSREHTVSMAAFGLSGSDTTVHTVYVYERPQAIFDVYPTESRNLKQNFKFINNSQDGSYYLWDFGDGTTSPDPNPNHFYEDSGSYTITLYVFNEHDCADTLVKESFIKVIAGEGSIEFPTAFVLNEAREPTGGHWDEGTINNNVFHPAVINAVEYKLIIYTRWGEKIFESNDLYIGWDGFLESGNLATEGVYVWKAWVTYVDGIEEILFGDITFLH